MTIAPDHYDVYYADKLWNLLPAVYRTEDTDQYGVNGPLRELVNRIGGQAAILRRSIDRMWEDQSIDSCDDWIIPYIGDLLGTNLVSNLDPRGQRLDVANTISYRLRKGTLAVVEEIAANITGWDAKAVEFFRRLGRTRHGLDPAVGPRTAPADPAGALQLLDTSPPSTLGSIAISELSNPERILQIAQGLAGPVTATQIGGFADLRSAYGASEADSAFDEFFHTADVRLNLGSTGWYGIPKLGVFLWRLQSFEVGPVTPMAISGCPNWYTFDPTGRNAPLFSPSRSLDAYGSTWVSPREGQVAAPIPQALLDADIAQAALDPMLPANEQSSLNLYPDTLSVSIAFTTFDVSNVAAADLVLRPAWGRFAYLGPAPNAPIVASYYYGFPSQIAAGTYDRRIGGIIAIAPPPPNAPTVSGGGGALCPSPPGAIPTNGALVITDSLTYDGVAPINVNGSLTLQAENFQRPLLRLAVDTPLVITGTAGSTLTLDGIFLTGGDVVLRGSFASVTLSCCTLDPGSAAAISLINLGSAQSPPAEVFGVAADLRALVPTRIWVEGTVTAMTLDRCVTGPIRTRLGGTIESLSISNGIIQAIRTSGFGPLESADVKDPLLFERRVQLGCDPVSALLLQLEPAIGVLLGSGASPPVADVPPPVSDLPTLLPLINDVLTGNSLFGNAAFAGVPLSAATLSLSAMNDESAALNRSLLEDAYPLELADAALALNDGLVQLSRCTILGRIVVHQLEASESILQGLVQVDDTQSGCVRLCALAQDSVVPRQFESVQVAQTAALFTSVDFGHPAYAQLLPLVDAAILPAKAQKGVPQNTISSGAEDDSEMGAYARDKNPVKANALLVKLQEYMPAGLVPVIVTVT